MKTWLYVNMSRFFSSDEMFVHPIYTTCRHLRDDCGLKELFAYKYGYKGEISLANLLQYFEKDLGVSHFDEVILQFDNDVSENVVECFVSRQNFEFIFA